MHLNTDFAPEWLDKGAPPVGGTFGTAGREVAEWLGWRSHILPHWMDL